MSKWPKQVPALSPDLIQKKRAWQEYWLRLYPQKYSFVSSFTESFLQQMPSDDTGKILEIGSGPNPIVRKLGGGDDQFYALELNQDFCDQLARDFPNVRVQQGDVSAGLICRMACSAV
jgi:16S rRNA A1518/A1519 N6-dimethyltransferase RsmA/KsgA/DIM1 with predicted DNA glycosylase/AP lyase activity